MSLPAASSRLLSCLALALAVSSCLARAPAAPIPEALACPTKQRSKLVYDAQHRVAAREVDVNRDGRPDATFFLEDERVRRAELDLDFDGATDLWLRFDGDERVVAWEELPVVGGGESRARVSSGRLPDDRPPLEVARLVPGLDPTAAPECVQRPEAAAYLADVKRRVLGRWAVPRSASHARTRLSFSLDQSGAVVGACVREGDDPRAAEGTLHALLDSSPLPPMPDAARCLARRQLIGTFASEPTGD